MADVSLLQRLKNIWFIIYMIYMGSAQSGYNADWILFNCANTGQKNSFRLGNVVLIVQLFF